jgi:hypothetical protein
MAFVPAWVNFFRPCRVELYARGKFTAGPPDHERYWLDGDW